MSNPPGRSAPEGPQKEAGRPPGPDPSEPSARPGGAKETLHLKAPQSLERLRSRIEEAALELKRLREENAALAQRIADLETRPSAEPGSILLATEESPELLRRKVNGFIEAIDQYLQQEKRAS